MKLAELLEINDFKASDGWLSNFKDRHGIKFKSIQGEAAAVDMKSVEEWRRDILQSLFNFTFYYCLSIIIIIFR